MDNRVCYSRIALDLSALPLKQEPIYKSYMLSEMTDGVVVRGRDFRAMMFGLGRLQYLRSVLHYYIRPNHESNPAYADKCL